MVTILSGGTEFFPEQAAQMIAVKEDGAARDLLMENSSRAIELFPALHKPVNHRQIPLGLWQAITEPRARIGYDMMW